MTADKWTKGWFPYGLDAPGVVRNLLVIGVPLLVVSLLSAVRVLPASVSIPLGGERLGFNLQPFIWPGASLTAMGLWMLWGSARGKLAERERLLDRITWRGDERVLDVGCGRGLLLVGAARRLTSGRAYGVDLWRGEDLTGNEPAATLANATREDVAERVEVVSADMRKIPFADGFFDVILSKAAVHNLSSATDRASAIREMTRVLAPGGILLLDDIRHLRQYVEVARAAGLTVELRMHPFALLLLVITFGSLNPGLLQAKRPSTG